MAGRQLTAHLFIERPAEDVFNFVADYHNVARLLEGVKTWRPIGRRAEGVGARYLVVLSALGVKLEARVKISEWTSAKVIGWVSEASPIANRGRWTFTPKSGGSEVALRLDYTPPAGGIGNFLAARVEGIIRGRILAALQGMKEELEAS